MPLIQWKKQKEFIFSIKNITSGLTSFFSVILANKGLRTNCFSFFKNLPVQNYVLCRNRNLQDITSEKQRKTNDLFASILFFKG